MFQNNPNLAGQPAGPKLFSDTGRFSIFPVHTRFDVCEWFLTDAYTPDHVTGNPGVVFQGTAADTMSHFNSIKFIDQ